MENNYGDGTKPYAIWAVNMALSQSIGVPWIMCQQYDAHDLEKKTFAIHYVVISSHPTLTASPKFGLSMKVA